jgi:hypothetical protein
VVGHLSANWAACWSGSLPAGAPEEFSRAVMSVIFLAQKNRAGAGAVFEER